MKTFATIILSPNSFFPLSNFANFFSFCSLMTTIGVWRTCLGYFFVNGQDFRVANLKYEVNKDIVVYNFL